MKNMRHCLFLILLCSLSIGASAASFRVTELKTDYRVNPIGLEAQHLHFSWQLTKGDQVTWQVQAAGTPELLAAGKADLWDSGKRPGAATTQIAYEGVPLPSRQRVWWRVRAWNPAGQESAWSAPAYFEMALLKEADWQNAQWIGDTRNYQAPELAPEELMGPWIASPAGKAVASFFKDIVLPDKPVVSAMAYWGLSKTAGPSGVVVNLDKYTGAKRSQLGRSWRVRPNGFIDMAFYLQPGKTNRVELRFERPPQNLAATIGMRIVFADGEEMTLASGADWQVQLAGKNAAAAAVQVAEPYGGAKYGKAAKLDQTSLAPAWFREPLAVRDGLRQARLYLCALGEGQAYVNGVPADDRLLSPPQSDYEELAFYTTQDITPLLKPGPNALAVLLDGGWYHEVGGFGTVFSYGRPGLKALVALEYADGKTEWVVSGPDWRWKEGAIRSANIYRGEVVDFRRDQDEWKSPDAGTGWQPAQVIPPCTPKTLAMDIIPVRRDGELKPIQRWQIGPKTWLFDVGEMIHGWAKFSVDELSGTTVRLRYSEYAKDGVMENAPTSQWWCHGVTQGDEIIADGKLHVFEPTFTPKSFRFVEVSGMSRPPEDLVAVRVHSGSAPLATFTSSDPMLNRLFENGMHTFRNYLNNILGDIPRERCLWGAESIYSIIPATYCFDWAPNHRLMNTLWWTGAMTKDGVPGQIGVGKRLTTMTQSFIWSATPVFLTSQLLEFYGDAEPMETYYDKALHFVRFYEKTAQAGIPTPNLLADHAATPNVPRQKQDSALINAMFFFEIENRFARMADQLGKTEDAAHARAYAEIIRGAVMKRYDPAKHTFGNGTEDSLALAYGLVTDPAEANALASSLVGYYRANGHQFDGGFMSYEIYPMLAKYGYVEDAYEMLVNPDYAGPAWSVKTYGATSFYELYTLDRDQQMKVGQDFIAYAHSIGWMITDLAGIRYAPGVPNGKKLRLSPQVPRSGKLNQVNASLQTPMGRVQSAWTYKDCVFNWTFTVPANVSAEVHLPADTADGVKGAEVMKRIGVEPGGVIYQAAAGTYTLQSPVRQIQPVVYGVPAKATSIAVPTGNAKEWKAGKGSEIEGAGGVMTLTRGNEAAKMLTTKLPAFSGRDATISFRMKTPAVGKGGIRLVAKVEGRNVVKAAQFDLGAPNEWNSYTVPIPVFDGVPVSLWLELPSAREELQFSGIGLKSGGSELKRWSF